MTGTFLILTGECIPSLVGESIITPGLRNPLGAAVLCLSCRVSSWSARWLSFYNLPALVHEYELQLGHQGCLTPSFKSPYLCQPCHPGAACFFSLEHTGCHTRWEATKVAQGRIRTKIQQSLIRIPCGNGASTGRGHRIHQGFISYVLPFLARAPKATG